MELKDLAGLAEALKVLRDEITPWRRQHAKEMAHLEAAEKEAQIELIKAGTEEKKSQARKALVEIEKEKLSFLVELAQQIIESNAPNLPIEKRIGLIAELLPVLNTLTNSESEQVASVIIAESRSKTTLLSELEKMAFIKESLPPKQRELIRLELESLVRESLRLLKPDSAMIGRLSKPLIIEGTWRLTWTCDNRTLKGVLMLKQKGVGFRGVIRHNDKNLIKLEGAIAQNKAKYNYRPYAIEFYQKAHPAERGKGYFDVLDGGLDFEGEWRSEDGAVTTCSAKRMGDLPGEASDQLTTPEK